MIHGDGGYVSFFAKRMEYKKKRVCRRTNEMTKKISNFELLRIVAALLIIAHHYAMVGCDTLLVSNEITVNRLFSQFLFTGGKFGVNLFVLISGYFLSEQKFRWSKFITLQMQVWFYSIASLLVLILFFEHGFSVIDLVKAAIPLIMGRYSFATTYLLMYLFNPYINIFIHAMDQKQHQRFLVIGLIICCILPTFTVGIFQVSELMWFIYLYILASYIRCYGMMNRINSSKCLIMGVGAYFGTYCSIVIMDFIGIRVPLVAEKASYFIGQNKLPMFLASLLVFLGAQKGKQWYNSKVNFIASAVFGIYLIPAFPDDIYFLWKSVFHTDIYCRTQWLYIHSITSILIVFVTSMVIEWIRAFIYRRTIGKLITKKIK